MTRAVGVALCTLAMLAAPLKASAAAGPQVWVAGKHIRFSAMTIAYGDPVTPADDAGLTAMLDAVGAQSSWQPGTRYVTITRADGKLVTLTAGSNAITIDGKPAAMPFAPYYHAQRFMLPLLPIAQALGLGVRGYHAGYVFVPQIVSVRRAIDRARTLVEISAAVPVAWRSRFDARSKTLTLEFEGFGTLSSDVPLGGRDAVVARVRQSGPPGYPTASVAIVLARGAHYAAHRLPTSVGVGVVITRGSDLGLVAATPTPIVTSHARATPPPTLVPSPVLVPTATPVTPSPLQSESPGPTPSTPGSPVAFPSSSPSGSPLPGEVKLTSAQTIEVPNGTRIVLTLTGSVNFEWHRLDQPDNRYWLDIHGATLVGPAQTLSSKLPFITQIQISQHEISPERVVRVAITPTQPIDVVVGQIEGAPDQMGIEIANGTPAPGSPRAGIGTIAIATAPPSASPVPYVMHPDVIAIDPGHGGNDPGAINSGYGLVEKELALRLSREVRDRLERMGWHVVMTRDGDNEVGDPNGADRQELQARCDVANASGARLFVSIHMNSWVGPSLQGATVYYWRKNDRPFAQAVESSLVSASGLADDGTKRDALYVVRHTVMPAILVEAAFLSNPHDAALLQQRRFIDKLADGIANGIAAYAGSPRG